MKYPWIDEYLVRKKGVTKDFKQEWNWIRYMVGEKLFCAVCLDDDSKPFYITLKLKPEHGDAMRQLYPDVIPGYYMNKVHWNSVKAEGGVPEEAVKQMLDEAYTLVLSSLTKKKQMEIQNGGKQNETL